MKDFLEILVTVIGIVVGAVISIYQVSRAISPKRSSLHHDLETLKLARELEIPAKTLEDEIIQRLAKLEPDYKPPKWRITGDVIYQSVFGIIVALGLGYWTYYLSKDVFSWWSVLTGLFAFGGLMQPFVAFSEQKLKDERTPPDEKT
ncbi:hypothetical protein BH20ACI4_BH20ACI4_08150 [soil metagenome]